MSVNQRSVAGHHRLYGGRKPLPAWWWRGAMSILGTCCLLVPLGVGGMVGRVAGERIGLAVIAVLFVGAVILARAIRGRLLERLRERAANAARLVPPSTGSVS